MVNSTVKRGAFHLPCFSCFQYFIFTLDNLSHNLIPFSQVGYSRCPRRVEGALQRRGAQEQVALLRCRGQLLWGVYNLDLRLGILELKQLVVSWLFIFLKEEKSS